MDRKKNLGVLVALVASVVLGMTGMILVEGEQPSPRRPGSSFSIPEEELSSVLASANNDNLIAIRRLIYHFEQYKGDLETAKYWSARARAQGDENELKLYALELLTQAQYYAKDAEQKKKNLAEALVTAERMIAIDRSAENERLVQQIKYEQSRLKN